MGVQFAHEPVALRHTNINHLKATKTQHQPRIHQKLSATTQKHSTRHEEVTATTRKLLGSEAATILSLLEPSKSV